MSGQSDAERRFHPMDEPVIDAALTIRQSTSIADLRQWLAHERHTMKRRTVVDAIAARLRRIGG